MEAYKFTDDARRSLMLARDEAVRLHHAYVGTEHLLLGVLRLDEGGAAVVLRQLSIDAEAARAMVERIVKRGTETITDGRDLPYTNRARVVLDLARTATRELSTGEAREVGQFGIGSEHLLLGILEEGKGIGAQVLLESGLREAALRETIQRLPTARRPAASVGPLNTSSGPLSPQPTTMTGYNFTQNVRTVLAYSREEAVRIHHEYVGTEHMLLGILRHGEGVAFTVLETLNVDLDGLKDHIERAVKQGHAGEHRGPDLPYTSRAKKVLELAMAAARELKHSYVGTEHLLLGLIREEKGIAAQVLASAGVTFDLVRSAMLNVLGSPEVDRPRATGEPRIPAREAPTLVSIELEYERGWTRRQKFRTVAEARAFLAQL